MDVHRQRQRSQSRNLVPGLYLNFGRRQDSALIFSLSLTPMRRLFVVVSLLFAATGASALELVDCRVSAGPSYPGFSARCGTMTRPENPDEPDGNTIELRIAVVPALDLDPQPDPLVPISGGPGQSVIDMYSSYRAAFEPIRRSRDIVLVDQRGTGESALMKCPVDDALVEGNFPDEQTRQFTRECLIQLPHDPRYFTTSVAVRDLEAVRVALGYPSLNLYGISYGTRVAQHYARRYPETTRTVVIDGVVPPQLPLGPEIATESQRAVDDLFARCAENAACAAAFPDLDGTLKSLLRELRDNPQEVSLANPTSGRFETVTMGSDEVAVAIRLLVYQPSSVALVPLTSFFKIAAGDLGESLAVGMHNSVMCTEDIPFYDDANIDYEAIGGTYMGAMQLKSLKTICSVWPKGVLDDNLREPLATDTPVLLLSGGADPITPPRYAELAMEKMKNARHIAEADQGHGVLPVGCMPRLVAEFVDSGDPQAIDRECMDRAFTMPFFVDFPGPTP